MSNPFGGGGTKTETEETAERSLLVKAECLVYRIPPQVDHKQEGLLSAPLLRTSSLNF